jgi:isopenicillin-N N-acyltransferase-like protein
MPARKPRAVPVTFRLQPDIAMPLLSCEGTAFECGEQLGGAWKEVLTLEAERFKSPKAWWKDRRYAKLISKIAPHLPDLYRGMAVGAGLKDDLVAPRAPEEGGCTSFAIAPGATLDGAPISGQSKDVSFHRGLQLLVLRLKIKEGPSAMTLTYPGWLFGHGFVRGGTSIFRNSMYLRPPQGGLPYDIWGILALHCATVEAVMKLTRDWGISMPAHMAVADERGGVVGIEHGDGGPVFLAARRGIYAHANCVVSGSRRLLAIETESGNFRRAESLHRTRRMYAQLGPERGRLTPQLCYRAMCDHDGFPVCVCRHQERNAITASVVIVEPTRGLLHATRSMPCQSWPRTYAL